MRPAGGLCAPRAHPGPDGSGILPSRGRLTPHESVGGVRRPRADLWSPLRGPRVGFAPPPAPPVPGGVRGVAAGPPAPRPRCHAAPARPAPRLLPRSAAPPWLARSGVGPGPPAFLGSRSAGSASMPRGPGPPRAAPPPAFGRAALARPFRRRPRPARVPGLPLRRIGLDATRPRPAPRRASSRVRPRRPGSPVPGRSTAGPRPAPAPGPGGRPASMPVGPRPSAGRLHAARTFNHSYLHRAGNPLFYRVFL